MISIVNRAPTTSMLGFKILVRRSIQYPYVLGPYLSVKTNFQLRCYKHKPNVRTFLSDKERVRDFLTLLTADEKRILYDELKENPDLVETPTITVIDTTTTSERSLQTQPPSLSQLRLLFLAQALPFIGFGFLDNLLMILAGDYIDITIGVTFGISTMAAAGLGNALSDMAGVGSAYYVEKVAYKIGMKPPKLSMHQMNMTRTRWVTQIGRAIGVAVGCVIGMFPLLFLPNRSDAGKHNESKD